MSSERANLFKAEDTSDLPTNADSRAVIACPSTGCHASVNPFAGKPAGHRDDRKVGAISLPARGSCATSCIPDSPRLEPIASAVSEDDEVSARAITVAVTSKQSATAP